MRTCELHRKVLILAALVGSLGVGASGQVWEVERDWIEPPVWQAGAQFGGAVALGDFDRDGDLDLAVGAPFYDGTTGTDHGAVQIFKNLGSRALAPTNWQFTGGSGDREGTALAVGDFDGDGGDELAIGLPRRDPLTCAPGEATCADAGEVWIYKFDANLGNAGFWRLTELSWYDGPETSDHFGQTLAVGDFDGDGTDDLAVGAPDENLGADNSIANAGKVTVFYRPIPTPLALAEFYVGAGMLFGTITTQDQVGTALAAGDFDGNGVEDLAIGAPGRDLGGHPNAGEIHVVHGLEVTGLTLVGQGLISYASFGVTLGDYDRFGAALAAANFDESPLYCMLGGVCEADLAIGVPGDDGVLAPGFIVEQAGKVLVSYGSPSGLDLDGFTLLSQNGLSEGMGDYDHFGSVLAAGRARCFGIGGGCLATPADLVIGVPEENDGTTMDIGYVHLAFGAGSGVAQGDPAEQPLPPSVAFGTGPLEVGDRWGEVLAIGDLDGDGYGDLVVGLPRYGTGTWIDIGVVQVLYGAMYADGFETDGTANWSSTVTP